jgi:hypothetical protein
MLVGVIHRLFPKLCTKGASSGRCAVTVPSVWIRSVALLLLHRCRPMQERCWPTLRPEVASMPTDVCRAPRTPAHEPVSAYPGPTVGLASPPGCPRARTTHRPHPPLARPRSAASGGSGAVVGRAGSGGPEQSSPRRPDRTSALPADRRRGATPLCRTPLNRLFKRFKRDFGRVG